MAGNETNLLSAAKNVSSTPDYYSSSPSQCSLLLSCELHAIGTFSVPLHFLAPQLASVAVISHTTVATTDVATTE